jgi:radical SAM protein with 4Fe4S-binding SPASM domain
MLSLLRRIGFRPHTVVWELTLACNMNCRHCGSRAGTARPDELSTAEALSLARDLTALGARRVTLGGGEPTLRKDWPLITEALIAGGARVALLTNGRSWNRDLARQARLFGLDNVAFSVDGCEVTHDYIRRVPGQWQALLDNIDLTRAEGVKVGVVTQINRRNLQELETMREVLARHDVSAWQLQLGTPTGNLADHPELVIQPEDLLEIVPRIAALKRLPGRPRVYPSDNIGYYGEYEEELRDRSKTVPFWIGCRAGCSVIGIESNGNVKGCLSLPSAIHGVERFVEGNIRERPLKEIWEAPGAFAYNRQFTVERLHGFCRTCDFAEVCRGGCSWTSFAHVGDTGGNPYCYWRQLKEKEKREVARIQGEDL